MDLQPRSDTLRFADGDVTVVVTTIKIYQLHSQILRRFSPYFAQQLDAFPGARLPAAARREGQTPYRFHLVKTSPDDIGHFIRMRLNDNGRVQNEGYMLPSLAHGFGELNDKDRYWDWLFGCFYNIKPAFDDTSLSTILTGCMGLVDVAEIIGAKEHIRDTVEIQLVHQDDVLWQSIEANPMAWAELGNRVQSSTIFTESVVHLVGKWQMFQDEEKSAMNDFIRQLCERKWQELDLAKRAIDIRINGHYPPFLCRSHVDKPHRTSYSTDIYMWMALSFFRQWYAQAACEKRNRLAPDGGFAFYKMIAEGGQSYLHHEDFTNFHRYFPMSSKACNVLETHMNVLKEEIKPFVADLFKVKVHTKPENLQWFSCILVEKTDLPWIGDDGLPDADGFGDAGVEDEMEDMTVEDVETPMKSRNNGREPTWNLGFQHGNGIGAHGHDYLSHNR